MLVRDGLIVAVGPRAKVEALAQARGAEKLDVGGRVILPGFVDSHTHLIHAASRAEEYELKIRGASYEEIARKGGGILNSVKKLRAATAEALKRRALVALQEFAAYGTTTVEAKSGYGLDVTSELKILGLHQELAAEQPLEIVSTFLGAHVVPAEYRNKAMGPKRYVDLLTEKLLPEVAEGKLAEFCDVFCDRGAFSRDQSVKVWMPERWRAGATVARRTAAPGPGRRSSRCNWSGELRSPGAGQCGGYSRAGKIEDRGDAAARVRFSSGIEAIRSGAGAD